MVTSFRPLVDQYISRIQARASKSLEAARRSSHPRGPEFTTLIRRLASGGTLLIFSLLLGVTAHEQSTRDALKDWQTQNPPSAGLWWKILKSHGFEEVPEGSRKNNLIRNHPGRWDQIGEVWAAAAPGPASSRWIALLVPERESPSAELRVFEARACNARGVNPPDMTKTRESRPKRRGRKASPRLVSADSKPTQDSAVVSAPSASDWRPLGLGWTALMAWSESTDSAAASTECPDLNPKDSQQARISPRNSDPRAFLY